MNSSQVAMMITTLLGMFSGFMISIGFTQDAWTAVVGGIAAFAAWAVDYFWNKKPTPPAV